MKNYHGKSTKKVSFTVSAAGETPREKRAKAARVAAYTADVKTYGKIRWWHREDGKPA